MRWIKRRRDDWINLAQVKRIFLDWDDELDKYAWWFQIGEEEVKGVGWFETREEAYEWLKKNIPELFKDKQE
jgi:hypothetical protein